MWTKLRVTRRLPRHTSNRRRPWNGPITLVVDYDPDWDALYLLEAARIRAALGDRLLLIEHVGSTAVPTTRCEAEDRHRRRRQQLQQRGRLRLGAPGSGV